MSDNCLNKHRHRQINEVRVSHDSDHPDNPGVIFPGLDNRSRSKAANKNEMVVPLVATSDYFFYRSFRTQRYK